MQDQSFAVGKLNADKNGYKILYDYIPSFRQAYLLAQYAMNHDREDYKELIFIFPGWNCGVGVNKDHELYKYAERLAKKYKSWR